MNNEQQAQQRAAARNHAVWSIAAWITDEWELDVHINAPRTHIWLADLYVIVLRDDHVTVTDEDGVVYQSDIIEDVTESDEWFNAAYDTVHKANTEGEL